MASSPNAVSSAVGAALRGVVPGRLGGAGSRRRTGVGALRSAVPAAQGANEGDLLNLALALEHLLQAFYRGGLEDLHEVAFALPTPSRHPACGRSSPSSAIKSKPTSRR